MEVEQELVRLLGEMQGERRKAKIQALKSDGSD